MKKKLISFASTKLASAKKRFQEQAEEMNFFDEIKIYDEQDLDLEFKDHFKTILKSEIRGFGYWVWKPQIIKQELLKAELGDKIVYCDVGYHLNPKGIDRLNEYLKILDNSKSGILVFQQPSKSEFPDRMFKDRTEKFFTKGDLIHFYNLQNDTKYLNSPQMTSSCILFKKTGTSLKFMEEWLKPAYTNTALLDNSPSKYPDSPGFIWHQHDQSVFSLLCKKTPGVEILSESELCLRVKKNKIIKLEEYDWPALHDKPFWFKQHTSDQRFVGKKIINIFFLHFPWLYNIIRPSYVKTIKPLYLKAKSTFYKLPINRA